MPKRDRIARAGAALIFLSVATPAQAESVREILERRGVLGTWSYDCDRPASPSNEYTVYRAVDAARVQRDVMQGPNKRSSVGFVETVVEFGPNELQIALPQILSVASNARHSYVIRVRQEGRLVRGIEASLDGVVLVTNGRYVPNYPDRALRGKPTNWVNKCE